MASLLSSSHRWWLDAKAPQSGLSRPSAPGRHASLRPVTRPGGAPRAFGRLLCAAYLPVDAGGRAAWPDPERTSSRANRLPERGTRRAG
jgi:hypothetical protein